MTITISIMEARLRYPSLWSMEEQCGNTPLIPSHPFQYLQIPVVGFCQALGSGFSCLQIWQDWIQTNCSSQQTPTMAAYMTCVGCSIRQKKRTNTYAHLQTILVPTTIQH